MAMQTKSWSMLNEKDFSMTILFFKFTKTNVAIISNQVCVDSVATQICIPLI